MTNTIFPEWPAPAWVNSVITTRNLDHTTVRTALQLASEPLWLQQVHGNQIYTPPSTVADAIVLHDSAEIAVIKTADCLPILLCDTTQRTIAAIHGGWRSLSQNIIMHTLQRMQSDPNNILVYLGPAISKTHFEVGAEVYAIFTENNPVLAAAFTRKSAEKFHLDLYEVARLQLQQNGVNKIYGGIYCTYTQKRFFYSYRREGAAAGRMASLIWLCNRRFV